MTKLISLMALILLAIVINVPRTHGTEDESPEAVQQWFEEKLPNAKEKLTKLHFYFHETLVGNNPTAVLVAQANTSRNSTTSFGTVYVMDDPLTEEQEANSKMVGRVQGMYAFQSKEEVSLLMVANYLFSEGKYNGSSLSVLGAIPVFHKYREMPVLGGTGIFRLARGIATTQIVAFNQTTNEAVVEYNVEVLHYDYE